MEFIEKDLKTDADGNVIAKFALFSETGMNRQPQYNVQQSVNTYVGDHDYYDFVEEWLDNPWLRVVLFGLEEMENDFTPFWGVRKFECDIVPGNIYAGAKLIILWADANVENPKPFIENALINAINHASYNGFILSSLDYPWIKVVITGINNIHFDAYQGEFADVQ